jgi:hypothetical protein
MSTLKHCFIYLIKLQLNYLRSETTGRSFFGKDVTDVGRGGGEGARVDNGCEMSSG